jgi:hypothetical protein
MHCINLHHLFSSSFTYFPSFLYLHPQPHPHSHSIAPLSPLSSTVLSFTPPPIPARWWRHSLLRCLSIPCCLPPLFREQKERDSVIHRRQHQIQCMGLRPEGHQNDRYLGRRECRIYLNCDLTLFLLLDSFSLLQHVSTYISSSLSISISIFIPISNHIGAVTALLYQYSPMKKSSGYKLWS